MSATAMRGSGEGGSKLLEGVERIHWETTSVLCFVGATVAAMRYLGESVSNDEGMAISGGAFKAFWIPPWSPANCDLLVIGEEPIRRTFGALGYDYTHLPVTDRSNRLERELLRERIIDSIDRGVPVIADGVVGPPECCIVTGYERGGDVLVGWSYFQDDPSHPFRSADWYDGCFGLTLIGDKVAQPDPGQVFRDTLEWAVELARTSERPLAMASDAGAPARCFSGLAAYDAMVAALEGDDFPDDMEALTLRTVAIGDDGVHLLAAQRQAAASYLASAAEKRSSCAGALRDAANAYHQVSVLFHKAGRLAPFSGASVEQRRKLLDPAHRRKLAEEVRKARDIEERAVEHLERALTQ